MLKKLMKKFIPRVGIWNIVISATYFFWLIMLVIKRGNQWMSLSWSTIAVIIVGFFSINSLAIMVNALGARTRVFKSVLFFAGFIVVNSMFSYREIAGRNFDFAVAADNVHEIWYVESVYVLSARFGLVALAILCLVVAAVIACEVKYRILSGQSQPKPYFPAFLNACCFYLICVFLPVPTADETVAMFRSMYWYYAHTPPSSSYVPGSYPFIKPVPAAHPLVKDREKPNVIILPMESFNGLLVGKTTEQGEMITPVFNSLISRGLYIEHFYGNSVQTSKGHFATLFGVIPSMCNKVYVDYPQTHLQGLPAIFTDNGYKTFFFQAFRHLDFDNTEEFLKHRGMSEVITASQLMLPQDKKKVWGWGLEDDVFYERVFDYLDRWEKVNTEHLPFFAVIAPVSNHADFNLVPEHLQTLYPGAKGWRERYRNSLHASDVFLKVFIDEFYKRGYAKDTLLIILGDHSMPEGIHGLYGQETGAYEEFFRVPFLAVWEGRISPEYIAKIPYSQLDIAPSLIDMLGLSVSESHFIGRSVMDVPRRGQPVYLVQPYDGQWVVVVDYPFRYMRQIRTGKEMLFNIEDDPDETRDLSSDPVYSERLLSLRRNAGTVFLSQDALRNNAFWR